MDDEVMRLCEAAAQEIARASFGGPLDERLVNTRLVLLADAIVRLLRTPPAARELAASVQTWRGKLQAAANPRKRSARLERLDAELAQLQGSLLAEPDPDSTPEQYAAFLETLGHRLGRAVAQLLLRLGNERKPRKK
jgi:hypothetical protein